MNRSVHPRKRLLIIVLAIFVIALGTVIIFEIPSSSIKVKQVNIEEGSLQINGVANELIVQDISEYGVWASRGYDIYYKDSEDTQFRRISRVPVPIGLSYGLGFRTIRYLLNKHEALELLVVNENTLVAFAGGIVFQSINNGDSFIEVDRMLHYGFKEGRGIMPQGYTTDRQGQVFWGEYWRNVSRSPVRVLKSFDRGSNWVTVKTFKRDEIRHIHSVQYDSIFDAIWVTTGDYSKECKILYSTDSGKTFDLVGSGTQNWRAVSLLFDQDKVYWGMDGGILDSLQIWSWDRLTGKTESMAYINSLAFYSAILKNGTMNISTDGSYDFATLWVCKDKKKWEQAIRWERKRPNHYGSIRMIADGNNLILSNVNLQKYNNSLLFVELN